MFDTDQLTSDCRAALREQDTRAAIDEIVSRAISDPGQILRVLGEPQQSGVQAIHRAPDLTILNVIWGPGLEIFPHDHRMWAVIGVYGGREDNSFYRRGDGGLVRHGNKVLEQRDTIALGDSIIHSVKNPLQQFTAALHVYGGDFFDTPRSEWDPETLEEHPYDIEHALRVFEEANRQLQS
jgi:predicted metal-dependent enzyme (double-stranded beta helix superfamily)